MAGSWWSSQCAAFGKQPECQPRGREQPALPLQGCRLNNPALHDLILSLDVNTSAKWVLNGVVSVCSVVLYPLEKCKWFYKVQGNGKSAFPRLQLAGEIQINSCGIQLLPKSSILSQVLQGFFTVLVNTTTEWLVCLFIKFKEAKLSLAKQEKTFNFCLAFTLVWEFCLSFCWTMWSIQKAHTFFPWLLLCVWDVVAHVADGISWQDELFPGVCISLTRHYLSVSSSSELCRLQFPHLPWVRLLPQALAIPFPGHGDRISGLAS